MNRQGPKLWLPLNGGLPELELNSPSPSEVRYRSLCPVSSHSHNNHRADNRSRNRSRADIHNHSMDGDSRNSHDDSIVGNKPFRWAYRFSFELAEFRYLASSQPRLSIR